MTTVLNKPIAIVISDIHYNLNNLQLANQALKAAINQARIDKIPLVIAGDLNDSKAIIRAEVANALIDLLGHYKKHHSVEIFILEGNHDKINEKGVGHGLNYLAPYANIVDNYSLIDLNGTKVTLVPYQTNGVDLEKLKSNLVIMHQGVRGAWMGDYIQDKTSIDPELLKDFTVISGHYHRHQKVGTITYIGSPYTITYGEANDGPKGFLKLYSDGSYDRIILSIRKHIIVERTTENYLENVLEYNPGDLLWMKIKGTKEELKNINKKQLKYNNVKLDLILPQTENLEVEKLTKLTDSEIFDKLIDNIASTEEHKAKLKQTWKSLLNEIT